MSIGSLSEEMYPLRDSLFQDFSNEGFLPNYVKIHLLVSMEEGEVKELVSIWKELGFEVPFILITSCVLVGSKSDGSFSWNSEFPPHYSQLCIMFPLSETV